MKRMTTKEIALWKRANAPGSLTARTADELLALRAEIRRLRKALIESMWAWAEDGPTYRRCSDALRRRAKAR